MEILGIKISDKGYYINLPKSVDRVENVNQQILKYELKNLERIDALTDPWHQTSCTKSHRNVFEIAKSRNENVIAVFEDDFQIKDKIKYYRGEVDLLPTLKLVFNDLKNVEWDVLLLGCNPKSDIIPITKNLGIITQSTGGWAYIIKQNAYEYILNNFNYHSDRLAIDDILPLLNSRGFKTLTTIPMLVHHAVGFESTLQPKGLVNYDIWINGSWDKHYYNIIKQE